MRLWLKFFSTFTIAISLDHGLMAQLHMPDANQQTPTGWHLFDSGGKDPASELTCGVRAGDLVPAWFVSSGEGSITITAWKQKHATDNGSRDELVRMNGLVGRAIEQDVAGGKLMGLDGGEFGGGLWFLAKGSSEQVQLSTLNVVAIVPVPRGALILTGLAHLSLNSGAVYLAYKEDGGNWTLRHEADLDAAPVVTARDATDSTLIVTSDKVLRFYDSGRIESLGTIPPFLQPNSVAIDKTGDIYIGMRLLVFRLKHVDASYIPEALIPDSCNFSKHSFCSCSAGKQAY